MIIFPLRGERISYKSYDNRRYLEISLGSAVKGINDANAQKNN
jgi:hypothetical protein